MASVTGGDTHSKSGVHAQIQAAIHGSAATADSFLGGALDTVGSSYDSVSGGHDTVSGGTDTSPGFDSAAGVHPDAVAFAGEPHSVEKITATHTVHTSGDATVNFADGSSLTIVGGTKAHTFFSGGSHHS